MAKLNDRPSMPGQKLLYDKLVEEGLVSISFREFVQIAFHDRHDAIRVRAEERLNNIAKITQNIIESETKKSCSKRLPQEMKVGTPSGHPTSSPHVGVLKKD